MDESTFETFEDELGTPLQETTPPKPIRQARRSEMYAAQRRMREEAASNPQQVPKTIPRETPSSRTNAMSGLRRALSMQSLSQVEVPFQGVTLNRCLFIAITILVITSGIQRLHETLRGRRDVAEEEYGLSLKHSALKKHHHEPEPESSLWDTFFWWVADDDDDDEEEDGGRGRKKKGVREKSSRGLRNRALPDKFLLKKGEGSLRDRKEKRRRGEEEERGKGKREHDKKAKKRRIEEEEEEEDDEMEDEEEEEEEEEEVKPKKKMAKNVKEKPTHPKGKVKKAN
ncbi:nucleolin [Alosa sapidissima]|uniref:nucleolin n=1 Tax=Alosa sapidissima TaxID=34773 RepID=UPI001C088E5B|nr:nucleolin [Alosa sapidissima]